MDHFQIIRRYGDTDFVTALRALAATMVVFVHAGAFTDLGVIGQNITKAGQYGVQIFFVISGFSIATTLTSAVDYRDYLIRRLFRIVPLYWLMILATASITFNGWLSPNYWSEYFGTEIDAYNLLMHLSFLSCFDHRIGTTIIGVEWTIPVEVFWYLVLPFVIRLMTRYRNPALILLGSVAIMGLTQFLARLLISDNPGLFAKWFPTSHGPYFLLGVLAFQLRQSPDHWLHRKSMSILGWAWPIAGLCLLIDAPGFGVISAILCVLTIGLFRVDASNARSQLATWGPFLFIGSISYSLYLVHFPIILLLKEHFGLVEGITLFVISYSVSLVLSAVLYLSVERPMNDLGKQFCKRLNQRSTKAAVEIRLGMGER
jgi:peptidoglycan/LPS O-acetylase OafA/YrhL